MLIRFNVRNFMSFNARRDGTPEEFSMLAGRVRKKSEHLYQDGNLKLLKLAAVYGANASGKSNLVRALGFMQETVCNGLPDGLTNRYCREDTANREQPTYFETELLLGGRYYAYGFEVVLSRAAFVAEWLVELHPDGTETTLFAREVPGGTCTFAGDLVRDKNTLSRLKIYAEDLDDSALFLSAMNQNKKSLYQKGASAGILRDVFHWFQKRLEIIYPNQPADPVSGGSVDARMEKICAALAAFGTGITGYRKVPVSFDRATRDMPVEAVRMLQAILDGLRAKYCGVSGSGDMIKAEILARGGPDLFSVRLNRDGEARCEEIEFLHSSQETSYAFYEESDGTTRLFDLIEILIGGEGKTYVIDELDRCLHPSLTYQFVKTYLETVETKKIQLIATTHESRLLDFGLLRRDEVWFVDRNPAGTSHIYSLDEYNTRFDQVIDKAYLEGRYGGVPVFTTLFPIEPIQPASPADPIRTEGGEA